MSLRPVRAAITGMGAVSGFGEGAELLWRNLLEGRRSVRATLLSGAREVPMLAAVVPGRANATDRDAVLHVARSATREAVADAQGAFEGERLAVVVGTTLGSIGGWLGWMREGGPPPQHWSWNGPAHAIAETYSARGPVITASLACASGNAALGSALELLRTNQADQVLVGGVDVLNDFVAAGFTALKATDPEPCRPFDRSRRGLNLGEGGCFLVLEEEEHARTRGARIRAYLDGYGSAADANHMTGPDREGRGAARAMTSALRDANCPVDAVDFVSTHGTATGFNDAMESKALHHVLGARAAGVPANSIKGAIGHTLGAAGALEALVCVRVLETGLIPPTIGLAERDPEIALNLVQGAPLSARVEVALSTSSGFGGVNAAIVLRRS